MPENEDHEPSLVDRLLNLAETIRAPGPGCYAPAGDDSTVDDLRRAARLLELADATIAAAEFPRDIAADETGSDYPSVRDYDRALQAYLAERDAP